MNVQWILQNFDREITYFITHGHFCKHEDMGPWCVCNMGADEVRVCNSCDRLEKRKYQSQIRSQHPSLDG
jgi:hypothetical protein